ncbi:MAG: CerR family C-terminal domain-containing protein [Desulfosarcina sp.]|nr:CerR family C-terminal domain-containing protein [Desulfobacterales bacterium]
MTKREDGKETRWRLLNAACEVFAQKGYRDAKVADICNRAGANIASVNYYFRDKASLYAETWRYAFQQFEEPAFSELADGSPQERLRGYIQTLMKNFTTKRGLGYFSRLYLMEIVNPTGLIKDDWRELIDPQRRKLHDIIREIMGQEADDQSVLFCELSIVNQCRILMTIKEDDLEYLLERTFGPKLIKRLADHIADFSLAGIRAVGKRKT